MFDDYSAGLFSGMLIQAADSRTIEKEYEQKTKAEQLRAFRLALKLMQDGDQEIIETCLRSPKEIEFYANLYDV